MVLVVLMVLEELVVFVGGIFDNYISPIFLGGKFIEPIKKIFGAKKTLKILKTNSKIHLYLRVVQSSIPLEIRTLVASRLCSCRKTTLPLCPTFTFSQFLFAREKIIFYETFLILSQLQNRARSDQ